MERPPQLTAQSAKTPIHTTVLYIAQKMSPQTFASYSYFLSFVALLAAVSYQTYNHLLRDSLVHYFIRGSTGSEVHPLVIAVASRLDRVEQRQAIRKTWKRLATESSTPFLFFSPERHCPIDEYWRVRRSVCQPWNVFVPANLNEEVAIKPYRVQPSMVGPSAASDGIGFVLKFPVSFTQLGLSKKALKAWADATEKLNVSSDEDGDAETRHLLRNLTVELVNAKNGDVETSANFSLFELRTVPSDDGFMYLNVDGSPDIYPRGFEGILRVTGLGPDVVRGNLSCNVIWNKMFGEDGLLDYTGLYHEGRPDSVPFHTSTCPLVTAIYHIPDLLELRQVLMARDTQNKCQENKNRNLQGKLVEEAEDYGDQYLVSDLTDTDDNMPLAMLGLFSHVIKTFGHFEHLLVTSDDSFVAVDQLLPKLQQFSQRTWRSNFRRFVPVQRSGESAERRYHSSQYPLLPAKSGSVLSKDLVEYLVRLDQILPSMCPL